MNYKQWENVQSLIDNVNINTSLIILENINEVKTNKSGVNNEINTSKSTDHKSTTNSSIDPQNILNARLRSEVMKTRSHSNVNYTLVSKSTINNDIYEDPNNFSSAWDHPNSTERVNWRLAIEDEIKTMIEKNVFELVDREKIPSNQKPILTKWVFKRKMISGKEKELLILDFNSNQIFISLIVTHLF